MEIGSKRYTIANDFTSPRCKFAEPTVSHTASVDAQPRVGSLRSTAKLTMQNGSSQPLHSVTAASQAVTPAIFGAVSQRVQEVCKPLCRWSAWPPRNPVPSTRQPRFETDCVSPPAGTFDASSAGTVCRAVRLGRPYSGQKAQYISASASERTNPPSGILTPHLPASSAARCLGRPYSGQNAQDISAAARGTEATASARELAS